MFLRFKKDIGALGVSFEEIGYNYHIMISYFQALIQYNNNSEVRFYKCLTRID